MKTISLPKINDVLFVALEARWAAAKETDEKLRAATTLYHDLNRFHAQLEADRKQFGDIYLLPYDHAIHRTRNSFLKARESYTRIEEELKTLRAREADLLPAIKNALYAYTKQSKREDAWPKLGPLSVEAWNHLRYSRTPAEALPMLERLAKETSLLQKILG